MYMLKILLFSQFICAVQMFKHDKRGNWIENIKIIFENLKNNVLSIFEKPEKPDPHQESEQYQEPERHQEPKQSTINIFQNINNFPLAKKKESIINTIINSIRKTTSKSWTSDETDLISTKHLMSIIGNVITVIVKIVAKLTAHILIYIRNDLKEHYEPKETNFIQKLMQLVYNKDNLLHRKNGNNNKNEIEPESQDDDKKNLEIEDGNNEVDDDDKNNKQVDDSDNNENDSDNKKIKVENYNNKYNKIVNKVDDNTYNAFKNLQDVLNSIDSFINNLGDNNNKIDDDKEVTVSNNDNSDDFKTLLELINIIDDENDKNK